jgi:CubicO group peptidase (beta-lactamase class C family)
MSLRAGILITCTTLLAAGQVMAQSPGSFSQEMPALMDRHEVPGVSMAIIRDGALHETRTYGVVLAGSDTPVTSETMFSVGSISKVGNAFLTLKLVSECVFDLDAPVNNYLESWQIPESRYNREQAVTLRHLLSHTGGTSVHGFADFYPGETLPTTVQILEGSGPAKNQAVHC